MSEKRLVAIMRNNQWGKNIDLYNIIKKTKKISCPGAHTYDINNDLKIEYDSELDKYKSNDKISWQAERFLNSLSVDNYLLMYHKGCKEALILKIKSQPKFGKIENVKILRDNSCKKHKPIKFGCKSCNASVIDVMSLDYLIKNMNKYGDYLSENYNFENFYSIYRDIEIVGKIDSKTDMYKKYVCLESSIRILKEKVLL